MYALMLGIKGKIVLKYICVLKKLGIVSRFN
jgi:hypothetical protein